MKPIKEVIALALSQAIKKVVQEDTNYDEVLSSLEAPAEEKFGDLSTHLILKIAKRLKKAPKPLAEEITKELTLGVATNGLKSQLEKISVEGPGFINFHYSNKEIASVILNILKEGDSFGKPKKVTKKNILLEFVSANPTGPLTVAHGRQAALGDSLARVLEFRGHAVTREYYNNDDGVQINILGESTLARSLNKELPENGYKGDYLIETAKKLKSSGIKLSGNAEADKKICSEFAKNDILQSIQKDLADFDVKFDNYYSQAKLQSSGKVEQSLEELKKKGVVYESEGAVWFRSTDFGDDKDRVLIKSDKSYTYLTPDIAYHHEKFSRGFDELIDIWGPDHHGYIPRLKASQAALGHDPEKVHVLIAQLVTLFEGDKQVRMSTRAGEFVTLRQILDEVGKDAGRFFFLMRKFDAHLDFDLNLAKSQTVENPVFYIQYAHARIESIKKQDLDRVKGFKLNNPAVLEKLSTISEIRLMRLLSHFEETVIGAERTLEPFRLVPYLMELAAAFHRFYTDHRVISEDAELTEARLGLVLSTQSVIRQGLGLLGVFAPLKM